MPIDASFYHPRSPLDRALVTLVPLAAVITELAVAVAIGASGNPLAVGAEGVLHLRKHLPPTIDMVPQPGDLRGGLASPLQPADRASAGCCSINWRMRSITLDVSSTFVRPPPALRARPIPPPEQAVGAVLWPQCAGSYGEVLRLDDFRGHATIPSRRANVAAVQRASWRTAPRCLKFAGHSGRRNARGGRPQAIPRPQLVLQEFPVVGEVKGFKSDTVWRVMLWAAAPTATACLGHFRSGGGTCRCSRGGPASARPACWEDTRWVLRRR